MIALVGSTGYVGTAFRQLLETKGVDFTSLSGRDIANGSKAEFADALKATGAKFLVNCAGYTGKPNVDACELDKGNCLDGNAVLPGLIREVCGDLSIGWGHVSSGCIFGGERPGGGGWREDDAPNFSFRKPPCSFYSGTKALGEEVLGYRETDRGEGEWPAWEHESSPEGYVWRLRIPFNEIDNPRNYLTKMQSYACLLQATNSLSQLEDFVTACFACYEQDVPKGIYNVTNPGAVTTSQVVDLIKSSGVNGKEFKFFESEDDFMSKAAKTPRSNCILDDSKLKAAGVVMRPVEEALEWSLKNWKKA
ncbi:sugar nucleotide-binding protein [Pelagicoccus albus]|uniref:dTDP-4-dehydrorhamnose reductase n=1 Tax=Pelagicoccus albus TaxID=415222 RepID=A0A7X1E7D7_9BACT|nr:sugar nucleotide-binding protein [Pelagicoccus albus]MBC2604431.1 sugar nucleotide-binding protein [Pelagicoccus albus]MBC2605091.1 sugar nucleotide-binding protein [Pelagicoccus albus]MBC2606290.1 sugar nucleotide-binding protein [Pelagicoccus albus]MBC2608271.1 sugar nucleotide-binding protein [Pelagicoccus albus]